MLFFQADELNPGGALLSVSTTDAAGTTIEISADDQTLRFTMAPRVVEAVARALLKTVRQPTVGEPGAVVGEPPGRLVGEPKAVA